MSVSCKQKFKCPKCRLIIGNVDSVCCDKCDNWFHPKCTKLSSAEFFALNDAPSSTYHCYFCKKLPLWKM